MHPELAISKKSMLIMNSVCNDLFDRLGAEASRITKYAKKKTLTGREMNAAVKLVFPGELAAHAVHEGTKAVARHAARV